MKSFQITNCYDSHVHWLATGEQNYRIELSGLTDAEDVQNLKITADHYRGDWIIGFGWDQYNWKNQETPNRQTLDKYFESIPVAFARADGHAY